MKWTLSTVLLILTTVLHAQTVKLSCTIKTDNVVYKKGSVPKIKVEIKNNSDSIIHLVKSLDGSSSQIRFPHAYFKIEMLSDTSYKISTHRACGNYDGIDSADFVEVKPGEIFDPYQYQTPVYSDYSIKDPRNFEKAGKYRITYYYSTNQSFFPLWMGDRYAGQALQWIDWKTGKPTPEKEEEYNHLIELFKTVPKTELVSNALTIEIK